MALQFYGFRKTNNLFLFIGLNFSWKYRKIEFFSFSPKYWIRKFQKFSKTSKIDKNFQKIFKEKVEYERLKLEEQISMLEKVIEEGIKQTTELQEIHHSEVEDLHKQVCSKKFRKIQKFRRKSQKGFPFSRILIFLNFRTKNSI